MTRLPGKTPPAGASAEALENRPVSSLHGVGPGLAERLARLGIATVQDLLFHLPTRYEDRSRVVPIGSLQPGRRTAIEGEIELADVAYRRRRSLLVRLADGSGSIVLRFFYFSRAQQATLARGQRLRCFGEVRRGPGGLEMVHPEYRLQRATAEEEEPRLTPVYPSTEGLQQTRLRALTERALATLDREALQDWLAPELLNRLSFPPLADALRYVHRPPLAAPLQALEDGKHPAQRRLAFEELLAHHLALRLLRESVRVDAATPLRGDGDLCTRFLGSLPFRFTGAQTRVLAEIERDLARDNPMLRLVQGDVGSGKTVVAAAAALRAVECGLQAAVMAPTELLADQHLQSFSDWFGPLGIQVTSLSGKLKAAERRAALKDIATGAAQVAVGTHALFQEGVQFRHLALAVVDEQHRFGVHQRLALREKGETRGRYPHQLIMTATPIPRTLAMTAYADLDVSVIDELPPGRKPVRTVVVSSARRAELSERVRAACAAGRQAYWVCPLIDESELIQCQAAEETAAALSEALPELEVALVHGRMKPAQRDKTMLLFKSGKIDLLVATTVIEVGVDVPNASLMIIENSERMGLAQLHQLRGRVGRGEAESSCVLMYQPPLSQLARERLTVLRDTNDGFAVAARDLELRGPGEVLGTRQTGLMQMRVADLMRDADLLPSVQEAAAGMLAAEREPAQRLIRRWVGEGGRYGNV